MDQPVFEVIDGDKHFKIWASGRVEGFDRPNIINRIPLLINKARKEMRLAR